jgi:hypothetical protein
VARGVLWLRAIIMKSRSLLLAAALLTSLPHAASASELRLSVGGGAGAAFSDPCGYDGGVGCTDRAIRTSGGAPLVLAGFRHNLRLSSPTWRLRIGGTASALLIAPMIGEGVGDGGSVVTGAGEFGVEWGRFAIDQVLGVSRVRLGAHEMTRSGATVMTGFVFTARLTPELAAFGRADLHAMMHAPIGGVFAGVGIEWTPQL